MKAPDLPVDEEARLAELRAYEVLDTPREAAFDRLTTLASTLFDVPMALITLVDHTRQWFKSAHGLDPAETSRDVSFCGHALHERQPMVVPDALEDERFFDNPLVTGAPSIRFYAGAPLTTPRGHRIGTLCLLDRKPRTLSPEQQQVLLALSDLVVDELELRSASLAREREAIEFEDLLQRFPTAVVVINEGTIRFSNAETDRMLGYAPGELLGRPHLHIIHPEERDASLQAAIEILNSPQAPEPTHRRLVTQSGETLYVVGTAGRLTWKGKRSVFISMRDVTQDLRAAEFRKVMEEQLNHQLELMQAVFDVLPDGIVLFDSDFRCVYANKAVGGMFGLEVASILGWAPEDAARHVATLTANPTDVLAGLDSWRKLSDSPTGAQVFHFKKPRERVIRRTLHSLGLNSHPWLSVWSDITHEATKLALREEEASTDALTRLPNRRGIAPKLARAIENGGILSVALFDIDHFKRVNDTYGHPVGDEVIEAVGQAIASAARNGDLVGRWGGEEFIAVLRTDLAGARAFAERARVAVAALETQAGHVTISAGIAQNGLGVDLVKNADLRLYEAKRSGRDRVCG